MKRERERERERENEVYIYIEREIPAQCSLFKALNKFYETQ